MNHNTNVTESNREGSSSRLPQPKTRSASGRYGIVLVVLLGTLIALGVVCWWQPWRRPEAPLSEEVRRLVDRMKDRLALMPDVARVKWRQHKPIHDPDREAELLNRLVARGKEMGLDPPVVRDFFSAQIEAARRVQEHLFERWQKGGAPTDPVSNLDDIRHRLDALSQQLLADLPAARQALAGENQRGQLILYARRVLIGEGIDEEVQDAALAPLLQP